MTASLRHATIVQLVLLVCLGCGRSESDAAAQQTNELVVFAAMSLRQPLSKLASQYESQTDTKVVLNFAGSNLLAQQIENSAAAHVFFSADEAWIRYLEQKGALQSGSVQTLLSNRLVVVVRKDSTLTVSTLGELTRQEVVHVATGNPDSVPVGRYAKSALQQAGVWQQVSTKLVPTRNVRAAVTATAADPSTIGLVYRTDVGVDDGLNVLLELSEEATGPIRYLAAVVDRSAAGAGVNAGADFIRFCATEQAAAVFESHGYIPL